MLGNQNSSQTLSMMQNFIRMKRCRDSKRVGFICSESICHSSFLVCEKYTDCISCRKSHCIEPKCELVEIQEFLKTLTQQNTISSGEELTELLSRKVQILKKHKKGQKANEMHINIKSNESITNMSPRNVFDALMNFEELKQGKILYFKTYQSEKKLMTESIVNLKEKNISNICYFKQYSECFQTIKQLQIGQNNIHSIEDLEGLRNLQILNVSQNKIKVIEINAKENEQEIKSEEKTEGKGSLLRTKTSFERLTEFDCSSQWEQVLNGKQMMGLKVLKIHHLPYLLSLNASDNQNISSFSFKNLPLLQAMTLVSFQQQMNKRLPNEDFYIPVFDGTNLPALKSMNINKNDFSQIYFLSRAKSIPSTLVTLLLGHNNLKQLPKMDLPNLKHLLLTKNRFKNMKQVQKLNCLQIKSLNIFQNPLISLQLFNHQHLFPKLTLLSFSIRKQAVFMKWVEEIFLLKRSQNKKIAESLTTIHLGASKLKFNEKMQSQLNNIFKKLREGEMHMRMYFIE